ncbi:MAG: hypothetical protein KY468_08325 [Armatimonadetes bacterium]|nr:hypothetical protein [Armatimonadota bacterium]
MKRMKKFRKGLMGIAILVIFCLFLIVSFPAYLHSPEVIENRLAKALPKGTTKTHVVGWLKANGYEAYPNNTESNSHILHAYLRGTRSILFCSYDLHIEFYFDMTGSLTDHNVEEEATCL